MQHLNSNILCAVAIDTTGPDPTKHELMEVAVIPIDYDCKVDRSLVPFNMLLKPDRPEDSVLNKDNTSLMSACERGSDPYEAADLFEAWFRKFNLKYNKRIMVLTHDWSRQYEFLRNWLQPSCYEMCFDERYRDTQVMGLFINDLYDRKNELCPFPKTALKYMCAMQKVEYEKKHMTVIDKCAANIALYRSLISANYF